MTKRRKFSDWQEPEEEEPDLLDRSTFADIDPKDAAERLANRNGAVRKLRPTSLEEKTKVMTGILEDFAGVGIDVATVEKGHLDRYRGYLAEEVEDGRLSTNTAAHRVTQWNAMMRAAFGPDTELTMKSFPKKPRKCLRLGEEELDRLIRAVPLIRLRGRDGVRRSALRAYLEVARCAGPRIGSLLEEKLTARCIEWKNSALRLEHMKNTDDPHWIVLTDSALTALRNHLSVLARSPFWQGEDTILFMGPEGKLLNTDWVNECLKRLAVEARIDKNVTTHILRKSAGTLIARDNERFAREQLGITDGVFQAHYNLPLLEDRLTGRDKLPGSDWTPTTPEEIAGAALLALQRGSIDQAEFERRVEEANRRGSMPRRPGLPDPGYA